MAFVSSSIYHKASRLALSEGLSPDLLVDHQQLSIIKNLDKYIPIELLYEVYELADQNLAPGFAVRQGSQLISDDYGTLGMSWKTSWRAIEIFYRLERYMILVTDQGTISIREQDGMIELVIHRDSFRRGLEMANETSFVMISNVIKEVTGRDVHPVRVDFKHSVKELSPFTEYFQGPVHANQPENTIYYQIAALNVPTIKADRHIHDFILRNMEEEKSGIHVHANRLVSEVKALVVESLPSGIPSVTQVGEQLGMSARTLKRKLSEKGLSFREVVQHIQQDIALDLLKNTSASIGEIAFQTGFSEQSAFNRAFKRWKGQSPLEFRKLA